MDEDEATNSLYAGNYSPRNHPVDMATIFKSTDEGKTWRKVFTDKRLDHIHTVRFDPKYRRIYIAVGDESSRGQVYSDDQGESWQKLMEIGEAGPQAKAFHGESRYISSSGWVYFTTTFGKSYRVRKNKD